MLVHDRRSKSHAKTRRRVVLAVLLLGAAFAVGVLLQRTTGMASLLLAPRQPPPPAWTADASLPVLSLQLAAGDEQQLRRWREAAVKGGGLLRGAEDQSLRGAVLIDQTPVPVDVRVGSSWKDQARRQCALELEVLCGKNVWGMTSFTLSFPDAATWDNPWLRQQHLEREGIVATKMVYLQAEINGKSQGVMQLREMLTQNTLRRLGRDEVELVELTQVGLSRPEPVGKERFHTEKLARFLAITELWSIRHALDWQRMRFLRDPESGLLEPIGVPASAPMAVDNRVYATEQEWVRELFRDDELSGAYVRELQRQSSPAHLADLRRGFEQPWRTVVSRFQQLAPGYRPATWSNLDSRAGMLRVMLGIQDLVYGHYWTTPPQPAQPNVSPAGDMPTPAARSRGDYHLWLVNAMKLPVQVVGVRVNGKHIASLASQRTRSPTRREYPLVYPRQWSGATSWEAIFPAPTDSAIQPDDAVEVLCRLWGCAQFHAVPLVRWTGAGVGDTGLPAAPSWREAVERHPFLEAEEDKRCLKLQAGIWNVAGDLVIPAGWSLRAEGGATLRFQPRAVLLCTAAVDFSGSETAPIRLTAAASEWGGVAVLNAAAASTWRHVIVERTSGVDRVGWTLTGGVTFYRSEVRLENCIFRQSRGEDAVNLVDTRFHFAGCRFEDSISDAFDGDFVEGAARNCRFEQIRGDAVDVSGSEVHLQQITMSDIGDKGISAGEKSRLWADHVQIVGAKMAVCSKDLSQVQVENLTVENATYALAAYRKKPEYGPAQLAARKLGVRRTSQLHLTQVGSRVSIDGRRMPEQRVDVEQLYAENERADDVAQRN